MICSSSKPSARPGHYLLIRFRKLIRHVLERKDISDSEMSLNWIAGHADILGNNLADKEARSAATGESRTSPGRTLPSALRNGLPSSLSATKQYHKASLQRIWMDSWSKSPRHDHLNSIDPSTPS